MIYIIMDRGAMVSGRQIRAARGLLGWSALELSRNAKVGWATIQRIEAIDALPAARHSTLLAVSAALEEAGIEFIGDPIHSPGVRLRL